MNLVLLLLLLAIATWDIDISTDLNDLTEKKVLINILFLRE